MNTYVNKIQRNTSKAESNNFSKVDVNSKPRLPFKDERLEAITHQKAVTLANNSPQVTQLKSFQQMASRELPGNQLHYHSNDAASNNSLLVGNANNTAPIQRMSFPEYEEAAQIINQTPKKAMEIMDLVLAEAITGLDAFAYIEDLISMVQEQVEKAGTNMSFRKPLETFAKQVIPILNGYSPELESKAVKELQLDSFDLARQIEKEEDINKISKTGTVAKNSLLVKGRIGAQLNALKIHDKILVEEASSGNKNIHGRGRHGFQTGTEGQIKRASSKVTPDQPSDEMGLGSTIHAWKTSAKVDMIYAPTSVNGNSILEGQAIKKETYDTTPLKKKRAEKTRESGGPYAGSFFSAEHQNNLITRAIQLANEYLQWDKAQFNGSDEWKDIEYLDVVLNEQKGGYGISFSKGKGKEGPYVLKIKDSPLVEKNKDLDVYLMLCAKVQLKRLKNGWQVLSSFPENLEPGISPIFNHGKTPWTGHLQNSVSKTTAFRTPPKWLD